jgi:ATP-dependent RNA helicase RhlB
MQRLDRGEAQRGFCHCIVEIQRPRCWHRRGRSCYYGRRSDSTNKDTFPTPMQFTELDFHPDLLAGTRDAGFTDCTQVQADTFAYTLAGRDVLVQSQTGTGKTAAFLLSIFHHLLSEDCRFPRRALVIAPTRELAVQIEQEARLLGGRLPFGSVVVYGGVGYGQQEEALARKVELVIGTPGRILDFARGNRRIDFRDFGFFVIDEADRLFDMGFLPDLRRIVRGMRPPKERLTMLFSATLSTTVRHLAWEHMNDPAEIIVEPDQVTVETVDQELYHVSQSEKLRLLLGILAAENPSNALIFTNMKHVAVEVAERLRHNGFTVEYIMGDLTQKKRLQIIDQIKDGSLRFLVATDVAARGLHINDLELVVNYDLPENPEGYVHRIGRTARAGKNGKAVSLACERYVFGLEAIEAFIGFKIPVRPVTDALIADDASHGLRFGRARSDRERSGSDRGRDGRERRGGGRERDSRGREGPSRGGIERSRAAARQESAPAAPMASPVPAAAPMPAVAPAAGSDLEARLAYYRRKYGENFKVKE